MTKLVACIVGINEEKNIQKLLRSILRITPIDAIWFLDGPWKGGEPGDKSTDNTKELFDDFANTFSCLTSFHWVDKRIQYNNESDKRNTAIQTIESFYNNPSEPLWILEIDGDEEIILLFGEEQIDLKSELKPFENNFCIATRTYLYGDPESFLDRVRIYPGYKGVHYHTQATMLYHDKHCHRIEDFNPGRLTKVTQNMQSKILLKYFYKKFHIINKWNQRDAARLKTKAKYYLTEIGGLCKYEF